MYQEKMLDLAQMHRTFENYVESAHCYLALANDLDWNSNKILPRLVTFFAVKFKSNKKNGKLTKKIFFKF